MVKPAFFSFLGYCIRSGKGRTIASIAHNPIKMYEKYKITETIFPDEVSEKKTTPTIRISTNNTAENIFNPFCIVLFIF
jgi:hypothetical protein